MATTLAAMQLAPTPPAPADRRTLAEEVLVVLALSLLASAAYAIVSLFQAPLKGAVVAAADQNPWFLNQFLGFVFGLAPVFLVVYLVRRDGEGVAAIGLDGGRPGLGPRPRDRCCSSWWRPGASRSTSGRCTSA